MGVNSGSGSSSISIFGLQLFDPNLGPIQSPTPVPSISHLSSCGGSTLDLDPAPYAYLGCNFLTSVYGSLQFQSHLCLTLANVWGQLWIWIQLHMHIWVVLFDINLGCMPSLAPIPSMSHLKSWGINSGYGSSSTSIFGMRLFDLNLGSTPAAVPSMSHLSLLGVSTLDPDPYLSCTF